MDKCARSRSVRLSRSLLQLGCVSTLSVIVFACGSDSASPGGQGGASGQAGTSEGGKGPNGEGGEAGQAQAGAGVAGAAQAGNNAVGGSSSAGAPSGGSAHGGASAGGSAGAAQGGGGVAGNAQGGAGLGGSAGSAQAGASAGSAGAVQGGAGAGGAQGGAGAGGGAQGGAGAGGSAQGGAGAGGSAQGGAGAGGSGNGGSAGSGGVPSSFLSWNNGFIDPSNIGAVQGYWYTVHDSGTSTILPAGFGAAGANVCVYGNAGQYTNGGTNWGSLVAFNANQAAGTSTANPWNATAHGIAGFKFTLTGSQVPSSIQVNVKVSGSANTYCSKLSSVTAGTSQVVTFGAVTQDCYSTGGSHPLVDATSIEAIHLQVPSAASGVTGFDFCVASIELLSN